MNPEHPDTNSLPINPETGVEFTQDEWTVLVEKNKKDVMMALDLLKGVYKNDFMVITPQGLLQGQGDAFRLAAMCEIISRDLKVKGEEALRSNGWIGVGNLRHVSVQELQKMMQSKN